MKSVKKIGVLSVGIMAFLIGICMAIFQSILMILMVKIPAIGNLVIGSSNVELISAAIVQMGILKYFGNLLLSLAVSLSITWFIMGIIVAALYNLFAKWIGGIKTEIV